jgi:hypothetical protein
MTCVYVWGGYAFHKNIDALLARVRDGHTLSSMYSVHVCMYMCTCIVCMFVCTCVHICVSMYVWLNESHKSTETFVQV